MLTLTGCAAPAPDSTGEADAVDVLLEESPEALLQRAQRSTRRVAAALRLRAATAYAELEDTDGLAYALSELEPGALRQADGWRLAVLRARLAFARGDAALAQTRLDEVPDARYASAFDAEELVAISRLRAALHEALGRPFEAARERVFLDGLLPPEERAENRSGIWRALTTLSVDEIDAARRAAGGEPALRGWLELARIARDMHPTLESQQREVELWLRRWADHPAAEAMPERLARLPELLASRARRIALLLPLSGPLAAAGKAVRDGFVAAQLEAEESGAFTPALMLLDSAALGAAEGYLQALEGGAELVVGPLARDEVDALLTLPRLEIPVLALNVTSDGRGAAGLVQFALLPEAEGAQLAERLHGDGLDRTLLLAQAAPWAGRIERAFRTRFEALGGEVVESQSFASTAEVGEAVAAALLVAESEARARFLRRIVGTQLEFEPRRRRDVDAIVALADPLHGGTLKPALDYYFAGDLPVYASSQIHDPEREESAGDSPLAGVRFCDMPWRLLPLATRRRMNGAWPGTPASLSIFHAVGVDAWRLHARLGSSTDFGEGLPPGLAGVTGDLAVDPFGRVERALSWAIMAADGPMALPRVVAAP